MYFSFFKNFIIFSIICLISYTVATCPCSLSDNGGENKGNKGDTTRFDPNRVGGHGGVDDKNLPKPPN